MNPKEITPEEIANDLMSFWREGSEIVFNLGIHKCETEVAFSGQTANGAWDTNSPEYTTVPMDTYTAYGHIAIQVSEFSRDELERVKAKHDVAIRDTGYVINFTAPVCEVHGFQIGVWPQGTFGLPVTKDAQMQSYLETSIVLDDILAALVAKGVDRGLITVNRDLPEEFRKFSAGGGPRRQNDGPEHQR